jgi:hypothetical protein
MLLVRSHDLRSATMTSNYSRAVTILSTIISLLLSIKTRGTVVYNTLLVIVNKYTKAATYILYKDTVNALALA